MIAGDLHGNRYNFERIVGIANLERHTGRHVLFQELIHGGPTTKEGGCRSFRMLEELATLMAQYRDRVHVIMGNHELAEITEMVVEKAGRQLSLSFEDGLKQAYGADFAEVRHHLSEFIRSMPLAVRTRNKVFASHSIPGRRALAKFDMGVFKRSLTSQDLAPRGPVYELVWGRDLSEETAAAWAALVKADLLVVGHKPCPRGFAAPNSRTFIVDSKDENGRCVLVPLSGKLTLDDLFRATVPILAVPTLH